jgi:hypothetical protein
VPWGFLPFLSFPKLPSGRIQSPKNTLIRRQSPKNTTQIRHKNIHFWENTFSKSSLVTPSSKSPFLPQFPFKNPLIFFFFFAQAIIPSQNSFIFAHFSSPKGENENENFLAFLKDAQWKMKKEIE